MSKNFVAFFKNIFQTLCAQKNVTKNKQNM